MAEPTDLKYSKTHEWARIEGGLATVGISQHAQEELGDVALILLPKPGQTLRQGEKLGEIESIKAVSDLYSPVSGEVAAVNEDLTEAPERINEDPYGGGWLLRIKLSQPEEANGLMDADAYAAFLQES